MGSRDGSGLEDRGVPSHRILKNIARDQQRQKMPDWRGALKGAHCAIQEQDCIKRIRRCDMP